MSARRSSLDDHLARMLLLLVGLERQRQTADVAVLLHLDFLVRYPSVLEKIASTVGVELPVGSLPSPGETEAIGSRALRYKFNVDQHRYRVLLGALVGMKLVSIEGKTFKATKLGKEIASRTKNAVEWRKTRERISVATEITRHTPNIATLIYDALPDTFLVQTREL